MVIWLTHRILLAKVYGNPPPRAGINPRALFKGKSVNLAAIRLNPIQNRVKQRGGHGGTPQTATLQTQSTRQRLQFRTKFKRKFRKEIHRRPNFRKRKGRLPKVQKIQNPYSAHPTSGILHGVQQTNSSAGFRKRGS